MDKNIENDDADFSQTDIRFPTEDPEYEEQDLTGRRCMVGDCITGCNGPCLVPCDKPCLNITSSVFGNSG